MALNRVSFSQLGQRDFAKQSVYDAHLEGKKHIKAAAALDKSGKSGAASTAVPKETKARKDQGLARNEALVAALGEELNGIREETRMNVERKQALTDKERVGLEWRTKGKSVKRQYDLIAAFFVIYYLWQLEDVQDIEVEEEEEEEEEQVYNPLKLPLGWDGKPIPYWLYKLHGLGVEYSCEICGNFVYMGRKAFDRHFQVSAAAFLVKGP